ncbi:sulfur carrier protein ThiS [Fodinisporobacter ferrooxydans]|uniref:Sulfur carrier protein ThiS n=1 Tax=Fodinisporobacter ferrooxydans TaxID=2901836 RepID=A0ABY4CPU4_9BACL|nr:sulfur carrier protein ThiS [Alicyclobacillaceae bacterium MYW30-H2]
MKLIVNGMEKEFQNVKTIADLVHEYRLNERIIIIEHNLEIVPRDQYTEVPVADGDRIEIVHFVGGG